MPRFALAHHAHSKHVVRVGRGVLARLVRELATHPGDALERLEHARGRWRSFVEEDFPDEQRQAFRHLDFVLTQPAGEAMNEPESLPWAAYLCRRIVAFADTVEALEADEGAIAEPDFCPSGVRIRSTPEVPPR